MPCARQEAGVDCVPIPEHLQLIVNLDLENGATN